MDMSIVNRQWSSRPDEERFTSLYDLHNVSLANYYSSQSKVIDLSAMEYRADPTDPLGLEMVTPNGNAANLSNWAFNQLCNRVELPPSFISRLPAKLASDNLNWASKNVGKSDAGILINQTENGSKLIRAVTGEKYGRIWNYQITTPLTDRFGDGISGDWKVPGEFGVDVPITKQNTTIYGNDRNMFVMLADEKNKLEVPNRRNGETGLVSRGFIIVNSEVGDSAVKLYFFTFDHVCMNRNIWGLGDVKEITVRHTSGAPERWIDEVAPAIEHFGQQKASIFQNRIIEAQAIKISGDKVDDMLMAGLKRTIPQVTQKLIKGINASHKEEEGRPIETVWDMSVGISAFAKSMSFQEDRIPLERAAGRILELAA